MPARIDLFFFDAGGGHRAAATALKTIIEQQQRPWQVRLLNLQELLDPIDILRRLTGLRIQDCYNTLLKRGWTLGAPRLLKLLQAGIRLYHPAQLRLLRQFWSARPPDMAVSLIPHFNRSLCEAFHAVNPGAPFVTILTDLADYPPHFWIEPQDQWVICGTPHAAEQALRLGLPPQRVHLVSGMILRPQFYEPLECDPRSERLRLGLGPDTPTGLVLFGGHGSAKMLGILRRLQTVRAPLQLILICGRNRPLAARLRATPTHFPIFVEEFTTNIPYYMRLADFFIGKPGPGSISEAVAMGLPVIVECNAWTLPQERYNARWIADNNLGLVVSSFRHIAPAAERLLQPAVLNRCRAAAAALNNRAVFEIPDILDAILSRR